MLHKSISDILAMIANYVQQNKNFGRKLTEYLRNLVTIQILLRIVNLQELLTCLIKKPTKL